MFNNDLDADGQWSKGSFRCGYCRFAGYLGVSLFGFFSGFVWGGVLGGGDVVVEVLFHGELRLGKFGRLVVLSTYPKERDKERRNIANKWEIAISIFYIIFSQFDENIIYIYIYIYIIEFKLHLV